MRSRGAAAALFVFAAAAQTIAQLDRSQQTPAAVPLPFSLSLGAPFEIADAPALHSFAFGAAAGKVVLVSGRTNGIHGFKTADPSEGGSVRDTERNFSPASANDAVWVIDLALKRVWRRPLGELPASLRDPLQSTNAEFVQDGDRLLIAGGYGQDTTSHLATTFPTLTVIDLPKMIDLVTGTGSGALTDAIQQVRDEELRVTGGALLGSGGRFFLLFGQDFEGAYTPALKVTASFTQTYTESVRVFTVAYTPSLTVTWLKGAPIAPVVDHDHFHRRDFSAARSIAQSGAPRLTVFGGVFRAGTMEGHLNAIHVDDLEANPPTLTVDPFNQELSQYACPTLALLEPSTQTVFTVFFGGLSANRYDRSQRRLIANDQATDHGLDGLGFIDSVSGIASLKDGSRRGFILTTALPGYFGTSAALIPAMPSTTGLLDLSRLTTETTVGYIFGGIVSPTLHSGDASRASSLFIPVIVRPESSSADPMPPPPAKPTP